MRHPFPSLSRASVVMFAVGGLLILGCKKKESEPVSQPPAATAPSPSAPGAATPAAPGSPATAQAGAPGKPAEAAGAPSTPAQPAAHCSASTLSSQPSAPASPLPSPVESMRRHIIAAAVACDYESLSQLSHEKGADFSFGFGDEKDLAATWRKEEEQGHPVLAHLVKVLSLPYAKLDTLYVWPSVYGPEATPEDWSALKALYSAEEINELRANQEGYIGFRTGIDATGDWQFALAGD